MHLDASSVILLLSVLLGVSEALAQVPQIQANSIFQALQNILKVLVGPKK